MQDFETLRQPLLRDLAMSRREERESEREREEKKMPFIVATYVYACSPRAAHALRSDQFSCTLWLIITQVMAVLSSSSHQITWSQTRVKMVLNV